MFSRFFIERPIFAAVVAILVVIAGLARTSRKRAVVAERPPDLLVSFS